MKTCTHKPESLIGQYFRLGAMLAGVGLFVFGGIIIELTEKGIDWTAEWLKELKPGPRDYP